MRKPLVIIGYSGHAFVCIDAWKSNAMEMHGYCEQEEKSLNPYHLNYLGTETVEVLSGFNWFVGIGSNAIRKKVITQLTSQGLPAPVTIIHNKSVISNSATIGDGVLIVANAVINPLVQIANGAIINTSASIDHECRIGAFAHIAPNATLCGNVVVGEHTFVGAGAVIKEGVQVGANAIIGAGSVIIRDIPDGAKVVGNPGKLLSN